MAFHDVCNIADLWEGDCAEFAVGGQKILLVWPRNADEPRAFQAHCPHQGVSLSTAAFDGKSLICPAHHWVFDAQTGAGINPAKAALDEYPLRVVAGVIQVDTSNTLAGASFQAATACGGS
jgi:toluene monooxygenase system ferredoxin subunit